MRRVFPAHFPRHGCTHLLVALATAFVIHLPVALAAPERQAAAERRTGSERVEGCTNFGRVTDLYFRGGAVSKVGVQNLYNMGVRTIIDLTGDRKEEAAALRLGMNFYSFPMEGSERPDDAKVAKILKIITEAKEPVYAHCAGGRHRAGTIAALYRIRVQGWSPERAWEEQESYGFGSPKDHRELYAYVYGRSVGGSAKSNASRGKHDSKHH